MKKIFPALFALMLLLTSCFKYINVDNSLKYSVSGMGDVTIDQNDSGFCNVYVELLSGNPTYEYIHYKVSGIPDSVTAGNDSLTFRPNYSFNTKFYAHSPKPGVYPITATMSSPSLGTKMYKYNLTVTSLTDCTAQLSQSQRSPADNRHDVQRPGSFASNMYAYIKRTGCDTIHIQIMKDSLEPGSEPNGVPYMIAEYSAYVNCASNSISIYPQPARWLQPTNAAVSGNGTYAPLTATTATLTLTDTVFNSSMIIGIDQFIIY